MTGEAVVHVVDDDVAVRQSLSFLLASDGLPVRLHESASAFLETVREAPSGCILTDVRMPGIDGIRLLAEVRARAPDTARIMLTGAADQATAMEAVNEGAIFRFLCKPCPLEVVARAIDGGVREHRLATAEKELIEKTAQGEKVVITRDRQPVAELVPVSPASASPGKPLPVFGSCRGMLTILSEDDEHLTDFVQRIARM